MTVKTVYPHTLSQSSGSNIQSFNNLSNLKNANSTYAKTGQIAKKSGTKKKPAAITAKNFKANIPAGCRINKVTVEYAADYEGNVSIGKPTINILNITGDNKKGKALTKSLTRTSVSWSGDHTKSNINSADFGVTISFPANTKDGTGYVKLKYIRIIIDYTVANFRITGKHVQGQYKDEEHLIQLTCSNVNKTKAGTNVNIQLPADLGYIKQESGEGYVTQNPGTPVSLVWHTEIGNKSSASVVLRVHPTTIGNKNIKLNETGSGHSSNFNMSVIEKPDTPTPGGDEPDNPVIDNNNSGITKFECLKVLKDEEIHISIDTSVFEETGITVFAFPVDANNEPIVTQDATPVLYWEDEFVQGWDWIARYISMFGDVVGTRFSVNTFNDQKFKSTEIGKYVIMFFEYGGSKVWSDYSSSTPTLRTFIEVIPPEDELTTLNGSLIKLASEELNRLGDGFVYTVQSWVKLITSEYYCRDWYKNFRIGVFNNRIEENIVTLASFGNFSNDSVTATLTLPDGAVDFAVSTEPEATISQSSNSVVFTKTDDNSNVNVLIDFLDSEDNVICTGEYLINFDDELVTVISNEYDPTDYSTLSYDTVIDNAAYWSNSLYAINTFENLEVDFAYDKRYPVYIITSGDYAEGDPINNSVEFTEPCIVESDVYNGREVNGNYPIPILSMVDDYAEEPSVIKLASFEESSHIIVYTPSLPEAYGTNDNVAIRGIEITADIDFTDDLILFAKLKIRHDNEYLIGNRSVVIDSNDDSLKIGGKYDTWGLNISELINLDELELELGITNILEETDATILLKNIQLTIYSNEITYQPYGIIIEDENVAWYGMDITNFEIPFGRKSETKYLNVEGTDTNIAYRQNIVGKDIKINFSLDGCDLEETTAQLQQLAKLFTNKRDELNAPIPKKIRFTHIPGKFFYFILEDTFDTDIAISDYKGSIEIYIPDGTAFDIEDTVTNVNGYVDGIASVNPIIVLTHVTDDQLTISEGVNNPNQVFKLNKENLTDTTINFDVTDTIIVNCINRECSLIKSDETELIDITEAVDFNSDWFKIQGEFEFTSENCVIQTVTYNTRS